MRRRKPGSDWGERWPAAESPGGMGIARLGRIVTPLAGDDLPPRERLEPLKAPLVEDLWRVSSPAPGRIVGDWLDGSLVYPEPPRRIRGTPLDRLAHRLSPAVWPFVLLWAVTAATMLADTLAGGLSVLSLADLAVRLAYTGCILLLPAAVLVWRRDAWPSVRIVFVGAVIWTSVPGLAGLTWWLVRRSPALFDRWGAQAATVMAVATIVAFVGPAVMALGIDRLRHTRTLLPGVRGLIAMGAIMLGNGLRWLSPSTGAFEQPPPALVDPLHLPETLSFVALPIGILCLGVLACSAVSAALDEETPASFWRSVAAGVSVLAAVGTYQVMSGDPLGGGAVSGLATRSWDSAAAAGLPLAGVGLLVLAFTSPIWSTARDAASWRAAPDQVFAWGDAAAVTGSEHVPLESIVAVAAGADHALAIDARGNVAGWGNDELRQAETPNGLTGVVAVAAGDGFSMALRGDGTVVAWGANDVGQTDVPPDLRGVVAIAAGRSFGLALTGDGTVVGWGGGSSAIPVPSHVTGIAAISAGERHCLALRRDGTVMAWGDDRHGQTQVPHGLRGVVGISAGGQFSLALREDGTVAAWGDNSYGQLDVPRGLEQVVAISAGAFHAVALIGDGDVVAWGGGGHRLGEAVHPWRLVDFKAVAAGDGFSLAVRAV